MVSFWDIGRWIIEIGLLAVMFLFILRVLKNTSGMFILGTAAGLLISLYALSATLDLPVLLWLLEHLVVILPTFVIVIFQEEIRRILTSVKFEPKRARQRRDHGQYSCLHGAIVRLSGSRTGAIIAIEQSVGLEAWASNGVPIHAQLTDNQLLEAIFFKNAPLHDGGVIIRKNEIVAAKCTFPVEMDGGNGHGGMRHKAGLGLSRRCDAVVIVISEETGNVTIFQEGRAQRMENMEQLRQTLNNQLLPMEVEAETASRWEQMWRMVRRLRVAWTRGGKFARGGKSA